MTTFDVTEICGEYARILRWAGQECWLSDLVAAHATPIGRGDSDRLLGCSREHVIIRYRGGHGRASFNAKRQTYRISLPSHPGTGCARLRAGVVIHEVAHVIDHRGAHKFSHGPSYCRVFRRLLASWRKEVKTPPNYREIYARHTGPYSLVLTRQQELKGKPVQVTDRVRGPFDAEDAHEEARLLVGDPRDTVVDAHVFSESEQQFIGAGYRRGVTYTPWTEMEDPNARRMEPTGQRAPATPLQGRPEPLPDVVAPDDVVEPSHADVAPPTPADRPVRNVLPKEPRAPKRQGVHLGIAAAKIDTWPSGPGAVIVREALIELGEAGITAADLAKRLAEPLAAAGVQFPASLISRLKQGGFLQEVS